MRCICCGKFISEEQMVYWEYTPDTEFTAESIEYWCFRCWKLEE
jgi:hypothetical protein